MSNYKSQFGQDQILNQLFQNKKHGVFVDIGAHDGITLSNSYFFEKELEWTGLCIEPLPKVFEQLKKNRSCIVVEGAAWSEDTTKQFRIVEGYAEMLSGFVDTYNPLHEKRIQDEVAAMGGTITDVAIRCYDVNRLLLKYNLEDIDFLSIDVEGSELDILKSIDYNKIKIKVVLAENNYGDETLRNFMSSKGYTFTNRIAIDDLYVLTELIENK